MSLPELEFEPRQQFLRVLHRWWLMVLVGTAGGLLALAFSMTHPAMYEASAHLGMDIAYGSTLRLELVVEDRVMGRVSALIESDPVLTRVVATLPSDLRASRGWATPADLRSAVRIDKQLGEWLLTVDDRDPAAAAKVANVWADAAIEALDVATRHAWAAVGLQSGPFQVDCKQTQPETSDIPGIDWQAWSCTVLPLKLSADALNGSLQNEIQQSQGILPVLAYSLLQRASPPATPVVWGRGTLVLAGTLIGFLTGVVLSLLLPARRNMRPDRSAP